MFTEEVLEQAGALQEEWQQRCLEAHGRTGFNEVRTDSGISLKPVYSVLDIKESDIKDIGMPGVYPYTRGTNPGGYRAQSWMMRHGFGYGTGEDTRDRWEYLRRIGMRLHVGAEEEEQEFPKFNLLIDLPTQQGYDPDDPEARGRVGECGLSICTMRDLELLFDGLPLDRVNVTFILTDTTLVATAMYVLYAERRGYPAKMLRMETPNILYRQWYWDTISFPPPHAIKLMVENIKYRVEHLPRAHHTNITGYNPGEAGATPTQEVAFTLAWAIAITEECIKAGLDPDVVVPRYYYHAHIGLDFFEEIAKFRAQRRMWAKIFKERFGCKNPQALKVTAFPQTSGLALPAQEPLNNIIRATLITLASVLAGVDGVWTASYDEALAIPIEGAAQIAVRTQQILYHETNIPSVADPLGGSYYIEWLTNRIEDEAWKLLNEVERQGGALKCWESGWFRRELETSANEWHARFARGERVMVGVNKYRLEEEQPDIAIFEHQPRFEAEARERAMNFKARRDSLRTQEALAELRATTERFIADWPGSCGTLMPAIFDAVRAEATLGEVQRVLREVCGYVYTY